MKNVVVFRSELLPPSETFILEQVRALTEWTPTLAGYRRVPDGIDLDGVAFRILPGLNGGRLQRWYLRACQLFGVAHRPTMRALRALSPDLIHVHFGTDAVDLWPSARDLNVPVLVTLHGFDINTYREWWEAGHGGWRRRSYPRRLLRMAAHSRVRFIAISNAIKQRAIEYGIPADKITVAYIGVNTHRFRPGGLPIAKRSNRILFVGRMVANKGPLLMIKAFSKIREEVRDSTLTMIGKGPLLDNAIALAKELAVPVEFLGRRSTDEILAHLHASKILCLPSATRPNGESEGLGMVLLEAQACGVPVVTTGAGGTKEAMIPNKTGLLCGTSCDATHLANSIATYLRDDRVLEVASHAAIMFARSSFDIASCTKFLESIYDSTEFNGR